MTIPLTKHNDAVIQTLPEYQIGAALQQCDFPGIAQCFAIVGSSPSKLVCAHISPGTTKDQMKEIFSTLKEKGGDAASSWYIVGPCSDHFHSGDHTLWNSPNDIRKTFRKTFGNQPTLSLLDTSEERNVKRPDASAGGALFTIKAIDIRATKMGIGVSFSYREEVKTNHYGSWQPLNIAKFSRL